MLDEQPSEWTRVTSGIPLGSIMGLLFFAMYIYFNDISLNVSFMIKLSLVIVLYIVSMTEKFSREIMLY